MIGRADICGVQIDQSGKGHLPVVHGVRRLYRVRIEKISSRYPRQSRPRFPAPPAGHRHGGDGHRPNRKVWRTRTAEVRSPFWPEKGGLSKVFLAFVVILLFTALLEITGYMINIFFLFLILLRPIGRQKWVWSISISVGAAVVSYLLFDKWLMIPLPRGIWFGN